MPHFNQFKGSTDAQLIAAWERIVDGAACGCPMCIRDLLDEIAQRFQAISAVLGKLDALALGPS